MAQITKLALKNALMELLDEQPLDKITIKDIVERCELNRNTFYYHFQDIYDLIHFVFTSEAEALINKDTLYTGWEENVNILVNYLNSHKKMIYHIYYSVSREQLEDYINSIIRDTLKQYLKLRCNGKTSEEKETSIVEFYKYAFTGLLLDWIKNGMNKSVDSIMINIEGVFNPAIQAILDQ